MINTTSNSSKFQKIFALTTVFIFTAFNFSPVLHSENFSMSDDLYLQIKSDIKKELYSEVKEELQKEFDQKIQSLVEENVRREFEEYVARQGILSQDQLAAGSVSIEEGESLDHAVRRTVREVFQSGNYRNYISDEELETVVAGRGIRPELSITSQYKKSLPHASNGDLAKNVGQALDQEEYEIVGGEEPRTDSIERTLQQKGSMLLQKGKLQFESSTTWAHFSSNRINIQGFSILPVLVIGDISIQETKRDVFIQNFTLKYGFLNNLQMEFKVPFRSQYNRDTISETNETTTSTSGVGDVEFGLSRQIAWEQGFLPDLIAAVNFKSTTGQSPYNKSIGLGTGHYGARVSLVAAKASDPAFIFGGLSYSYNFENTVTNIGKVEPGATIGYSLGMAIALSYQTAINFSFDHSVTQKLRIAGRKVDGSFINSANVKIGANWALNERASIDFSVAFGVTDDAPDVTAEVRFPFSF